MGNKTITARRRVYCRLYERRVKEPGLYFSVHELREVAGDPELTAALVFGREMNHLEEKRGHWRMTSWGMLFAEQENYVEGDD